MASGECVFSIGRFAEWATKGTSKIECYLTTLDQPSPLFYTAILTSMDLDK